MLQFIILILSIVSVSLNAITPQQVFKGAQLLYDAVAKNDVEDINTIKADQRKLNISIPELLKQARKIAKQKNDAQSTQYLTEQIIEAQKGLWQRYHGYIAGAAIIGAFIGGCRLGVFVEREGFMGRN